MKDKTFKMFSFHCVHQYILKLSSAVLICFILIFNNCVQHEKTTGSPPFVISQEQVSSFVRNFNPLIPSGSSRWPTVSGIYEPLFIYNSMTGIYVPWLATGYEWKDGNLQLDVTIRENVTWSDGQPFTAYDVSYTFNLKKTNAALDPRASWGYLKSVEAINDHLVRFKFLRIFVPGLHALTEQSIIPKHIWENIDDPVKFTNPNPVATGPFTEILRFDHQIWELGRNPHYWQEGKPAVERLRFYAYPTNEQATIALINGEVDWAGNFIPAIDRVFVGRDPENHHYWFPRVGGSIFLYVNTTKQFLDQVEVRKAISLAINRELIVRVAMYDYTIPAHPTALADGLAPWRSPTATENGDWVEYDIERANEMLDNAGFKKGPNGIRLLPDGKELFFDISIVSGWSDWIRAAQVISQNLKLVGINTRVKTRDFGAWLSSMQNGEFDMGIAWTEKGPTPYRLYRGLMSSEFLKPVGETAEVNWHRFASDEVDSLCVAFEKTSDKEEIKQIIYRMQEIFVDNAPAIPLFAEPSWGQYNTKRFTNFPTEKNPYAQISPNYPPENLLVLVNVEPK
ncbi:MAG: ABC transporter substrate-binding protein [Candidatus Marinimicrobia bacterium]|jgi:peptide/nickel transport system substrate-binding protein|nr:ABC transporter substrate-binding protein [Candidatus Neomarinimicrobiota bacterium]MBT3634708.1 ABC transporter substrate-binding protein [Candidatus Neomarinimicrobiota bacterium]MBT3683451.1 ABC transporter substrate-binding protein [Candidatus Neomarinimicrobiota bacterium]MBT3760360.1 ABC transporter substrate-binding protein [Candidatus Neomarinimicrobiota bacterium]MBT3896562.1 ABC transporter substrate-binding protein [Candidatus Neomarinimicrobiota bacterium]